MTLGCTSVLTEAGAPVSRLCFLHLFWIVLSNFAVKLPLTLWGIETTWGMFTYPFIYVTSDLTVRLYGSPKARAIVRRATIPGFFLSYLVGVLFEQGAFQGFASLLTPNLFVFRIALASLVAYFVSQNLACFGGTCRACGGLLRRPQAISATTSIPSFYTPWRFTARAMCGWRPIGRKSPWRI